MAGATRGRAAAILALAFLALALGCVLWWPRTTDDAYITFRYSQHLARGLGPVWNPGERVEGYTSPSWMALMALVILAGLDPVTVSKLFGAASTAALLLLLYRDLRGRGIVNWGAALAALAVGSSVVMQIWSVSGLETNAYALLFYAGLSRLARQEEEPASTAGVSALLAAAALTRPEGLAFWSAGLVLVALDPHPRKARRLALYAAPGAILVIHLLWRLSYYGVPLPNTYYAKTGGGAALWLQGWHGLQGFILHRAHVAWIIVAVAGLIAGLVWRGTRRGVAVMGLAVVLHLAYVVSVGDDGLRIHRFYAPILAPLAYLAAHLFRRGADARATVAGVLGLAVTVSLSAATVRAELAPLAREAALAYREGNIKLGRHLARTRPRETLLAVAAAGAIPYYSRLPVIDMYGLSDATIAHAPFPDPGRGRLMKWDNAYVLSRRPELIVINRGYFEAGDPTAGEVPSNPGLLIAAPMDRDLFQRVRADGSYVLLGIPFPDGSVFFVFKRREP